MRHDGPIRRWPQALVQALDPLGIRDARFAMVEWTTGEMPEAPKVGFQLLNFSGKAMDFLNGKAVILQDVAHVVTSR